MRTFGCVSNATQIEVWWADAGFSGQVCVAFGLPRGGPCAFWAYDFSMICVTLLLVRLVIVSCYGSLMFCCTGLLCISVRERSVFCARSSRPESILFGHFRSISAPGVCDVPLVSPRSFASL